MTTEAPSKLAMPVGGRDHTRGPENAPVAIVEYGDYQCVYCRAIHPILRDLESRLGDRLRLVFRHFPISTVHPNAQLAGEAAEAAAAQGRFWEMHDLLFQHQEGLDEERLLQYAADLGLDVEQFQRELKEHVHADRVREDFLSGVRSGVNGTPTLFINGVRYDGPWDLESLLEAIERPLGVQVRLLAQEFARLEASGGVVLLIAALLALFWANSAWSGRYFQLWETDLALAFGGASFSKHLLEWVNDGLMAIFFFVVGLEIKREVTAGELTNPKRAALPVAAAVGGMLVPAMLYTLFNLGGPGESGWGVPVATDIAFTLGLLAVFGKRVPLSLKVFFTALAIADDLGAVLVIALFYTSEISWLALGIGAVILAALFGLNRARVYGPLPYVLLGVGMWLAFLASGVHATIAGVLLAMTIPTRNPANAPALLAQCVVVLDEVENAASRALAFGSAGRQQAATQTLEAIANRMQSPAQRLERDLHPWTTYLILPIFALANAGVGLGAGVPLDLLNPVSLGVILGLVLGKPLGISSFAWLAVKSGLAELPADVGWWQLVGASALAGIGFTMSLFIANAAFEDPALLVTAKVGIIVASLVAGVVGFVALRRASPGFERTTEMEAPAS